MLSILTKSIKHFIRTIFQKFFFHLLMLYLDRKLKAHLDGFVGSLNIPKNGSVIIVSNHQSYFDGFVITSLFWKLVNRKVKIPTNIKALTNSLIRECQVAGGAVPINPSDSEDTYKTITELLNSGNAVVMYPEGTRSDGTFLHPFKYGAFNLAIEQNVPILPVAISNFSNVLPRGSLRFIKGIKGRITFGELIYPSDEKFKDCHPKDVAHQIKTDVHDWIYNTVINKKEENGSLNEEINHVSARTDRELELLLDQNVELITKSDVEKVSRIASTKMLLPKSSFDMDVQEVRIEGFRLNAMPKLIALLSMRKYIAMLNNALLEDKLHPYLNYCKGLLIQKSPQFYRKRALRQELQYFKLAYIYSAQYGYPIERFAHGFANSLYANGLTEKAVALLEHSFEMQSKQLNTIRQLRRRERGLGLMKKIKRESNTQEKNPTRQLRGFESFMAQSRISDVVIGQVDGIENFEQVIGAAIALHGRHPNLRAKVGWPDGHNSRPVFEFLPVDRTKVHVVKRLATSENDDSTRPFWEVVAQEEVNHIFDLSEGYMFRVTWLPETGHVILNAQHSVVDGLSLMNLLNEFVTHCGGENIGQPLPPTRSALEMAPKVGFIEKLIGTLHRESFLRARSKYMSWAEIKPQKNLLVNEQLETNCFFAKSSSDVFQDVISECKKQGATVGGVYAAALQCAILHFSDAKLDAKATYSIPMDFSLRRYFEDIEISDEAVGYLSGSGAANAKANPTMTFWALAKAFSEGAKSEVEVKSPLIFHKVFDNLWNAEKTYKKYGLDCLDSGGAGATITMSNVGLYKHKTKIGNVKLNSFHGMSASQRGGAMLYCWLRSVNNEFCYSFTSISPAISRDYSAELFGYIVFLMNHSTCVHAKDKSIKDYISISSKIYKDNKFVTEIANNKIDTAA